MAKKLFVVSDIHGHFSLLKDALDSAGYDIENDQHLLICCGDYFDRGDENVAVLKFFERVKNKVLLKGNHEDLLLELFRTGKVKPHNYINGTMKTLENFFGKYFLDPVTDTIDFSGKTSTVNRICEFIESTVNFFETENYLFVHGWLPNNCDTLQKVRAATDCDWEQARWIKWTERYNLHRPLCEKTLVCGHMPTFYAKKFDPSRQDKNSDIFYGNGLIAIDGGTYDTKTVNVLVIEDNLL